jgi:hypothetical protein
MVHVRLRDPHYPSQSPLREFAVADALSKQGDKSVLKVAKGHVGLTALFLLGIGGYRVLIQPFRKSIINPKELSELEVSPSLLELM